MSYVHGSRFLFDAGTIIQTAEFGGSDPNNGIAGMFVCHQMYNLPNLVNYFVGENIEDENADSYLNPMLSSRI